MNRWTPLHAACAALCLACPLTSEDGGAILGSSSDAGSGAAATTDGGSTEPNTDDGSTASTVDDGASETSAAAEDSTSDAGTTGPVTTVCDADPCSGDPVGVWNYDTFLCHEPVAPPADFCPGGTQGINLWIEGTLELTDDGSSVVHRRLVQTYRDVMPKSCVLDGNCDGVYVDPWSCTDDGETCDCTQSFYDDWVDETRPYTVEGSTITLGGEGGTEALEFCATDDALALIHLDPAEWTYLSRAPSQ